MKFLIKNNLIISFTEKILFIFFILNIFNLFNIILQTFGNLIIYEDSFALLNLNNDSFFYWLFEPHNGHIILVSKLLASISKFFYISQTGYNIFISIIILFIGLIYIFKTITIINPESKNKNLVFLICSYFWLSPWQWENLIWEFQFPWFLVVLLVIILSFITCRDFKNKNVKYLFIENLFLSVSPILAILSSGQGICYVNCLSLVLVLNKKSNPIPIICTFISYVIFIAVKFSYENNLDISINFIDAFSYLIISLATIFKAPISANNNTSFNEWIIPIISSLVFQGYLIISIIKPYFEKIKLKLIEINLCIPVLFGIQFLILTTITRSQYGIHQGAVSRYLTCINLIPIGLIYIFHYLFENKKLNNIISSNNFNYYKYKQFSIIISICLLITSSSFIKTVYQIPITYNTRLENFRIFKQTCSDNFKENIENTKLNYSKFKTYYGANYPPLPDAKEFKNFQKYLNSNICEITIKTN